MRNAPINYLVTLVLGGLVWLLTSLALGNYLGENVSLLDTTVDAFLSRYRLLLSVALALGLALTFYWFHFGSQPATAGKLPQAKGLWRTLFLVAAVVGVLLTFVLVVIFRAETFTGGQYATFFGVMSLNTYLLFWVATLVMSPRTVMNLPWGRS